MDRGRTKRPRNKEEKHFERRNFCERERETERRGGEGETRIPDDGVFLDKNEKED